MTIREVILDIETTGLDPKSGHRVVEIGAVEMLNKVVTKREFHCYINPMRDMPAEAYQIHGISAASLKDKPLFGDIADGFLDFIDGSILVIHNAPFDVKFLNYELSLISKPSLELSTVVDTLVMARKMFPGMKVNLDALSKRFDIKNMDRVLHGAIKDARILSEVYVELTGGRQVKFDINTNKQQSEQGDYSSNNNLQTSQTMVVKPTEEELQKHQEFLASVGIAAW